MAALIVRHRVADFAQWKKGFDSFSATRKEHGFTGHRLYRDAADPNMVTIVNLSKDVDGAKRYAGSPGLREAMQKLGVQGPPEVMFLEDVEEAAY